MDLVKAIFEEDDLEKFISFNKDLLISNSFEHAFSLIEEIQDEVSFLYLAVMNNSKKIIDYLINNNTVFICDINLNYPDYIAYFNYDFKLYIKLFEYGLKKSLEEKNLIKFTNKAFFESINNDDIDLMGHILNNFNDNYKYLVIAGSLDNVNIDQRIPPYFDRKICKIIKSCDFSKIDKDLLENFQSINEICVLLATYNLYESLKEFYRKKIGSMCIDRDIFDSKISIQIKYAISANNIDMLKFLLNEIETETERNNINDLDLLEFICNCDEKIIELLVRYAYKPLFFNKNVHILETIECNDSTVVLFKIFDKLCQKVEDFEKYDVKCKLFSYYFNYCDMNYILSIIDENYTYFWKNEPDNIIHDLNVAFRSGNSKSVIYKNYDNFKILIRKLRYYGFTDNGDIFSNFEESSYSEACESIVLFKEEGIYPKQKINFYPKFTWLLIAKNYPELLLNKYELVSLEPIENIELSSRYDIYITDNNVFWDFRNLVKYFTDTTKGSNIYDEHMNENIRGKEILSENDLYLIKENFGDNPDLYNEYYRLKNFLSDIKRISKYINKDNLEFLKNCGYVFAAKGNYFKETLKNVSEDLLLEWNNIKQYRNKEEMPSYMTYKLSYEIEKIKQEHLFAFKEFCSNNPEFIRKSKVVNDFLFSNDTLDDLFNSEYCIMVYGNYLLEFCFTIEKELEEFSLDSCDEEYDIMSEDEQPISDNDEHFSSESSYSYSYSSSTISSLDEEDDSEEEYSSSTISSLDEENEENEYSSSTVSSLDEEYSSSESSYSSESSSYSSYESSDDEQDSSYDEYSSSESSYSSESSSYSSYESSDEQESSYDDDSSSDYSSSKQAKKIKIKKIIRKKIRKRKN